MAAERPKRQYSRAFTPRTERRLFFMIDKVPAGLYEAVKAKAKRQGISLRSLILGWLKAWVEEPLRDTAIDAPRLSLYNGGCLMCGFETEVAIDASGGDGAAVDHAEVAIRVRESHRRVRPDCKGTDEHLTVAIIRQG